MTSGDESGSNGAPPAAVIVAALGPILFAGINIWSRIHDQPALADPTRIWEPVVWEVTSAVATLALIPLVWLAVRSVSAAKGRGPRQVGLALLFALSFYLAHVGGFIIMRSCAYLAAGSTYVFGGLASWTYEFPKDLVSFAILFTILWGGNRLFNAARPVNLDARIVTPLRIKDGARTFFVQPSEVMAARAAGNYVEFFLVDDRRPLSRGKLVETEQLLASHGFIRTHRSWLVNTAQVKQVRPVGSGDHELLVGSELEVPVSRRYAAVALQALV